MENDPPDTHRGRGREHHRALGRGEPPMFQPRMPRDRDQLLKQRVEEAYFFIGLDTPRSLEAVAALLDLADRQAIVALLNALAAHLRTAAWRAPRNGGFATCFHQR